MKLKIRRQASRDQRMRWDGLALGRRGPSSTARLGHSIVTAPCNTETQETAKNGCTLSNVCFLLFISFFFFFLRSHLIRFLDINAVDEIESCILLNLFPAFRFLQSCQGLFCIPTTATNVTYCFAIKISYKSVKNARDPNVRNKRRGYGFRTLLVDILFIFQME